MCFVQCCGGGIGIVWIDFVVWQCDLVGMVVQVVGVFGYVKLFFGVEGCQYVCRLQYFVVWSCGVEIVI